MANQVLIGALSRGSKNHASLNCRPCVYNPSSQACPTGEQCNFCHYVHDQKKIQEAMNFTIRKSCRVRSGKGKGHKKSSDSATAGHTLVLADCITATTGSASSGRTVLSGGCATDTAGQLPAESVPLHIANENIMHAPAIMETAPDEMEMEMMQRVRSVWPCLKMLKADKLAFVLSGAVPSHYED